MGKEVGKEVEVEVGVECAHDEGMRYGLIT